GTGMDFVAPRLPAPWHVIVALLRARGLTRADKLALARFSSTMRWIDWRMNEDCSVAELLERHDQTAALVQLMWRPLCIAALNTPPERASAQVFLNVLRDSLGARRSASDMLLPRVDLSTLFPEAAARFVEQHRGRVLRGQAVRTLERTAAGWQVDGEDFDAVVAALPPSTAAGLLEGVCANHLLAGLRHEPITTCYLQYEAALRLEQPFFALVEDPVNGDWGQFVFDRGQLDSGAAGMLAVVVSASGDALAQGHEALAAAIAAQLARVFGKPELERPVWRKVISEKRATFSCTPELARPENDTGCPGLVLAGDYTAGDYPATLEGAVRSGVRAAKLLTG
ncbi:MAG TPA: hydroxysqualene dehydroxylase HpnE, partial [Noviherbaspirillum sp.]|nr:hydroxysqualene dehydroxylase HpnE [Noviherbaspirillum sp.]